MLKERLRPITSDEKLGLNFSRCEFLLITRMRQGSVLATCHRKNLGQSNSYIILKKQIFDMVRWALNHFETDPTFKSNMTQRFELKWLPVRIRAIL